MSFHIWNPSFQDAEAGDQDSEDSRGHMVIMRPNCYPEKDPVWKRERSIWEGKKLHYFEVTTNEIVPVYLLWARQQRMGLVLARHTCIVWLSLSYSAVDMLPGEQWDSGSSEMQHILPIWKDYHESFPRTFLDMLVSIGTLYSKMSQLMMVMVKSHCFPFPVVNAAQLAIT